MYAAIIAPDGFVNEPDGPEPQLPDELDRLADLFEGSRGGGVNRDHDLTDAEFAKCHQLAGDGRCAAPDRNSPRLVSAVERAVDRR